MPHGQDICSLSAKTGEGVDKLLEMIGERLDSGSRRCVLHIPYDKGGLLDQLYREARWRTWSTGRPSRSRRCARRRSWADGAVPCGMSAPRPAPVRRPSQEGVDGGEFQVLSNSSRN